MKKLNKLQEELKIAQDVRKRIHEQNELFVKEIENIKKGPTEILELTNSMNGIKNATESICSRVEQMEDRISDLEERNFEVKNYTRTKIQNKNEGRKPTCSMGLNRKGIHLNNQESRRRREGKGCRNFLKYS